MQLARRSSVISPGLFLESEVAHTVLGNLVRTGRDDRIILTVDFHFYYPSNAMKWNIYIIFCTRSVFMTSDAIPEY